MPRDINTLKELKKLGVSPWYDNIERRLLTNGGLKDLLERGILGVTSNPSIFEKAIILSSEYDDQIINFTKEGLEPDRIYDELTIEDVRRAADLLYGVYESSSYVDGYVSIEVSPEYAHESLKTIEYGRRIFKKINRPNIMIKVPGTEESYDAIRALIKEGINVNITLLFSGSHYEAAAQGYIMGLKDRLTEDRPLNKVNSVASIFVSRLDTAVDKRLEDLIKHTGDQKIRLEAASLQGEAAIANAKLIYQRFKEIFYASEFRLLKKKGANIQRLVWASTGTKNPLYSDVKYIDNLIGQDTINTMPQATLDAYLDHGKPSSATVEKGREAAKKLLRRLSQLGLDTDKICRELQSEGLGLFLCSFQNALSSLKAKTNKVALKI